MFHGTSDPGARVLLALVVIVVLARLGGLVVRRLGQPAVVGEMVAGLLCGPSLLGHLAPGVMDHLFGSATRLPLDVLGTLGVSLFMFTVGLQHHGGPATRDRAVTPAALAVSCLVVPLVSGSLAAWMVVDRLRPEGVREDVFVLFVGGALAVTAFPTLARILHEQGAVRTTLGGVAMRAAAIDDAGAWCVLALVTALATDRALDVVLMIGLTGGFVLACALLLPRLLSRAAARVENGGGSSATVLVPLLALALGGSWYTESIGVHAVLGAYVVGACLPRSPALVRLVESSVMPVAQGLLLPVFFLTTGARADVGGLRDPIFLSVVVLLAVVAFASKGLVAFVVLRVSGWRRGESLAMGALLNARGLMLVVFADAGIQLGVIDDRMYTALVVVSVLTTMLALPLYRRHATPSRGGPPGRRRSRSRTEGGVGSHSRATSTPCEPHHRGLWSRGSPRCARVSRLRGAA